MRPVGAQASATFLLGNRIHTQMAVSTTATMVETPIRRCFSEIEKFIVPPIGTKNRNEVAPVPTDYSDTYAAENRVKQQLRTCSRGLCKPPTNLPSASFILTYKTRDATAANGEADWSGLSPRLTGAEQNQMHTTIHKLNCCCRKPLTESAVFCLLQ